MASRVTREGRRDKRFPDHSIGFKQQVVERGAAAPIKERLGEMPLTLLIIVAAIVLFFYLRRAHKGIDTHPGEARAAPVRAPQPKVSVRGSVPGTPEPILGGAIGGAASSEQSVIGGLYGGLWR